jgi:hypothetical protein
MGGAVRFRTDCWRIEGIGGSDPPSKLAHGNCTRKPAGGWAPSAAEVRRPGKATDGPDDNTEPGRKEIAMQHRIKLAACTLAAVLLTSQGAVHAQAPLGTAFSYQGTLKEGGVAADGADYDFRLRLFDDPEAGSQIGTALFFNDETVANGLFTFELDFGAGVFTGEALWLEVGVKREPLEPFTVLAPRQPLNAAPFALYALDGPGPAGFWADNGNDIYSTNSGNVGIGTTTPIALLEVANTAEQWAVYAAGPLGGVYGLKDATTGTFPGVHGATNSLAASASGVRGMVNSTTPGSGSAGVRGINNSTTGYGAGVWGEQYGAGWGVYGEVPDGTGVYGCASGTTGTNIGVKGRTFSADGYAGYFQGGRSYFEGKVGIGTTSPDTKLHIEGGLDAEPGSGGYLVIGALNAGNLAFDSNEIMARSDGGTSTLYINNDGGNVVLGSSAGGNVGIGTSPAARLDVAGNVIVRSASSGAVLIELGEGLDYAEGFDVSDTRNVAPGMVLVIDPDHPGQLVVSQTPYDRKVAGIVAGANGLGSAVRLGAGQFDFDVALAGRVYCNVDATSGAIQPGDLLTTSATPGHAMKVADYSQAQGAILGKAMQPLSRGEKGQILVLVTLQ